MSDAHKASIDQAKYRSALISSVLCYRRTLNDGDNNCDENFVEKFQKVGTTSGQDESADLTPEEVDEHSQVFLANVLSFTGDARQQQQRHSRSRTASNDVKFPGNSIYFKKDNPPKIYDEESVEEHVAWATEWVRKWDADITNRNTAMCTYLMRSLDGDNTDDRKGQSRKERTSSNNGERGSNSKNRTLTSLPNKVSEKSFKETAKNEKNRSRISYDIQAKVENAKIDLMSSNSRAAANFEPLEKDLPFACLIEIIDPDDKIYHIDVWYPKGYFEVGIHDSNDSCVIDTVSGTSGKINLVNLVFVNDVIKAIDDVEVSGTKEFKRHVRKRINNLFRRMSVVGKRRNDQLPPPVESFIEQYKRESSFSRMRSLRSSNERELFSETREPSVDLQSLGFSEDSESDDDPQDKNVARDVASLKNTLPNDTMIKQKFGRNNGSSPTTSNNVDFGVWSDDDDVNTSSSKMVQNIDKYSIPKKKQNKVIPKQTALSRKISNSDASRERLETSMSRSQRPASQRRAANLKPSKRSKKAPAFDENNVIALTRFSAQHRRMGLSGDVRKYAQRQKRAPTLLAKNYQSVRGKNSLASNVGKSSIGIGRTNIVAQRRPPLPSERSRGSQVARANTSLVSNSGNSFHETNVSKSDAKQRQDSPTEDAKQNNAPRINSAAALDSKKILNESGTAHNPDQKQSITAKRPTPEKAKQEFQTDKTSEVINQLTVPVDKNLQQEIMGQKDQTVEKQQHIDFNSSSECQHPDSNGKVRNHKDSVDAPVSAPPPLPDGIEIWKKFEQSPRFPMKQCYISVTHLFGEGKQYFYGTKKIHFGHVDSRMILQKTNSEISLRRAICSMFDFPATNDGSLVVPQPKPMFSCSLVYALDGPMSQYNFEVEMRDQYLRRKLYGGFRTQNSLDRFLKCSQVELQLPDKSPYMYLFVPRFCIIFNWIMRLYKVGKPQDKQTSGVIFAVERKLFSSLERLHESYREPFDPLINEEAMIRDENYRLECLLYSSR